MKPLESITEFADRCAEAGVWGLWISIGKDAQSGLRMLQVWPHGATAEDAEKANAAGIATRSFYADGDMLIPCDGQKTYLESIMRSNMTDAQKLHWLLPVLEEYQEWLVAKEAQKNAPQAEPEHAPHP